jgi:hypothetical protein
MGNVIRLSKEERNQYFAEYHQLFFDFIGTAKLEYNKDALKINTIVLLEIIDLWKRIYIDTESTIPKSQATLTNVSRLDI